MTTTATAEATATTTSAATTTTPTTPAVPAGAAQPSRLRRTDWLVLVALCVALYGWSAFSGRPLSSHEARVPQLAREMVQGRSDWILPHSGGRPWLERPPLPHWWQAGAMRLFGRTDAEWVPRLPAALMGLSIVLMGAWMAARWFGRGMGLLSGVVLATTYSLYLYSSLAEDDIFLAAVCVACVSLFLKAQFARATVASEPRVGLTDDARGPGSWLAGAFGGRPWPVVGFFVLLGLTNLAKGPLVGAAPIVAAAGVFLLWNRDWPGLRRYLWFWGLLIFLALALAWPLWALRHYPDVWDNWMFDYAGKFETRAAEQWNEPLWYYLKVMPMALAPWVWAAPIGLLATFRRARTRRGGAERFLWCWAVVGLIVLSTPARKHHHYLVPLLTPWAILCALGLRATGEWLFAKTSRETAATTPSTDSTTLPDKATLPTERATLPEGATPPIPSASSTPSTSSAPSSAAPSIARGVLNAALMWGLPGAVALGVFHTKIPGPGAVVALLAATWVACVMLVSFGVGKRRGGPIIAAIALGFVVVAGYERVYSPGRDARTLVETRFTRAVEAAVPRDRQLYVNAACGSLEFFRLQFYLRDDATLLHNLSFLRDRRITADEVYVVTRAADESKLATLGEVAQVRQCEPRPREKTPAERFTLYRLRFDPALPRCDCPSPRQVGVLEAMERKTGPWCCDNPL